MLKGEGSIYHVKELMLRMENKITDKQQDILSAIISTGLWNIFYQLNEIFDIVKIFPEDGESRVKFFKVYKFTNW